MIGVVLSVCYKYSQNVLNDNQISPRYHHPPRSLQKFRLDVDY